MNKFYLLIIRGDVEPELKGPFPTGEMRDDYALNYRHTRDESAEDGLYPLDQDYNGKLSVDASRRRRDSHDGRKRSCAAAWRRCGRGRYDVAER